MRLGPWLVGQLDADTVMIKFTGQYVFLHQDPAHQPPGGVVEEQGKSGAGQFAIIVEDVNAVRAELDAPDVEVPYAPGRWHQPELVPEYVKAVGRPPVWLFHATLAQALCEQALAVRDRTGVSRVGLSGGVFQNRVLTERVQAILAAAGFDVLIPKRLPTNDAAISYGQLVEAAAVDTRTGAQ